MLAIHRRRARGAHRGFKEGALPSCRARLMQRGVIFIQWTSASKVHRRWTLVTGHQCPGLLQQGPSNQKAKKRQTINPRRQIGKSTPRKVVNNCIVIRIIILTLRAGLRVVGTVSQPLPLVQVQQLQAQLLAEIRVHCPCILPIPVPIRRL